MEEIARNNDLIEKSSDILLKNINQDEVLKSSFYEVA